MIVRINGELSAFYAQTLCLTVFPGATFGQSEEPCRDVPLVTFDLSETDTCFDCTVAIELDGKTYTGDYSLHKSETLSRPSMAHKVCAGKAFMNAATEFGGTAHSWGILIGVRPAKLAMELLDKGMSEDEAVKVFENEYSVTHSKAKLAVNVAKAEKRLIKPQIYNECSLYVAIPFCPSRCSYCSFVSFTSERLLSLIPQYTDILLNEIKRTSDMIKKLGIKVSTIYIGGGTPTVLDPVRLEALLSCIYDNFDVSELSEYTVEAGRPDTITAKKLELSKKYGVSRISVNTQTLNNEILSSIGRKHTDEDFYKAYNIARDSGIDCINVDLIAGLPGESFESFAASVDKVALLRPENITVHAFSVKKSAEVKRTVDNIFSIEHTTASKCIDYSQTIMNESGYFPYYMYRQKNTRGNLENVGFSLPDKEGLYNVYMMEEIQSIFAVGASAVTKLVSMDKSGNRLEIKRIAENKYPYEYISEKTSDDYPDKANEFEKEVMNFYKDR